MMRQPCVQLLLAERVCRLYFWNRFFPKSGIAAVAGWGLRKPSSVARAYACRSGVPYLALEDGFLRSYGIGRAAPSLSLVLDDCGIYYATDGSSKLKSLLLSADNLLDGIEDQCQQAMNAIVENRLSKYNSAPDISEKWLGDDHSRILVVDQTFGDAAITHGSADPDTFHVMLRAAINENPSSTIYVKTHPEVSLGRKRGHFNREELASDVVELAAEVNPQSIVQYVDKVYVVTSHLGFEALLAGKPVICFGRPWYSGWGATEDRLPPIDERKQRSVKELFAAAYWHYTYYLNPKTYKRGNIFDVINWLTLQRKMSCLPSGRTIAIGFRRWKAVNVKPFLGLDSKRVYFVSNARKADALRVTNEDRLVIWGNAVPNEVKELAQRSGAAVLRMEDGFIRSLGLGSDFVPPMSLVLDPQGAYFDSRSPSQLEDLLNFAVCDEIELRRARDVRQQIVDFGLTKYNVEPYIRPNWKSDGRQVILVPGQVEDDASIQYGCSEISSNLELLKAVRQSAPEAYIVYKPHPDVVARNRRGKISCSDVMQYADYLERTCSIVGCIEACDEVHTMTSLAGFDALLRNKPVVTYGQPFYASWGLTTDHFPMPRRKRQLTLDELVAITLLRYPIYWDWTLHGYTTCEAVINRIIEQKERSCTKVQQPGVGSWARRQYRKFRVWLNAGFLQI